MKVLVAGATGYIGSAVAEALQASGHQVIGLARSDDAVHKLDRNIQALRGDLRNPTSIAEGLQQVDAVIYAASTNDVEMPRIEQLAVETILDALSGTGKTFIYTTGIWLLGNTGNQVATEDSPLDPTPLIAWRSQLESLVLNARDRNIQAIVIRPALVYGRGGGIIGMMVEAARQYGVVQYVGTGENRWTLIHVDDLALCYVAALEAESGSIFIAADDQVMQLGEIAQLVSYAAGIPGQVKSWQLDEARTAMGAFADALVLDQQVSGAKAKQILQPIAVL
ncbi:NAD-dependent epimerase/dehydratase family protein [Gloeocapsopsis crepidinum LEGE 06123]|uniref:NAD-dependent epimerase/dehydratase family protein n=1 Tax=Gloeocapsopsis crepidinum LEGE 06123 TaxID=588587 RepID=A0ABR9UZL5_9CHRO|nr:NAD-dependent epimerase/dehydratase family protein [Gloeocapsopsis crepidinum]MBE9193734.1 NAD-dependent epimerase/dehydratase family protein [Gloeocapsopsis crepidinum LEGE 06123]